MREFVVGHRLRFQMGDLDTATFDSGLNAEVMTLAIEPTSILIFSVYDWDMPASLIARSESLRHELLRFFSSDVITGEVTGVSAPVAFVTDVECQDEDLLGFEGVVTRNDRCWIARIVGNQASSEYWLAHWNGSNCEKTHEYVFRIFDSIKLDPVTDRE